MGIYFAKELTIAKVQTSSLEMVGWGCLETTKGEEHSSVDEVNALINVQMNETKTLSHLPVHGCVQLSLLLPVGLSFCPS